MKGARSLKGRQLAVFSAVFQWREGIAAQLDRAPFRVVHNDTLLTVAKAQPRSPADLQEAACSPDQMRRWGEGILGAVESGLGLPRIRSRCSSEPGGRLRMRSAMPDWIASRPRATRSPSDWTWRPGSYARMGFWRQ